MMMGRYDNNNNNSPQWLCSLADLKCLSSNASGANPQAGDDGALMLEDALSPVAVGPSSLDELHVLQVTLRGCCYSHKHLITAAAAAAAAAAASPLLAAIADPRGRALPRAAETTRRS